jgi:hypothetical protein
MEYRSLKGEPGSDVTVRDLGLQTDFSVYLQIRQTWLAFSEYMHSFSLYLSPSIYFSLSSALSLSLSLSSHLNLLYLHDVHIAKAYFGDLQY